MPADRFGEVFRDATGTSVRKWQMDDRVRTAQRLLADNPNESLADVASLCGFADQSHFSRAFLEVIGLTPTAWLHSRA
jgi:transcriptional regulator GlxA family with amidase domain